MRRYTNPQAHGYLMEAKACGKIEKELHRIIEKYQRAVDREAAVRKKDLEAALQYRSEREIQDDYGYEVITEEQYDLYLAIFREGEAAAENHEKSVNELALAIARRILSDIYEDRKEWEFCALSPQEQAKALAEAAESQRKWKAYIAELKARRDAIGSL